MVFIIDLQCNFRQKCLENLLWSDAFWKSSIQYEHAHSTSIFFFWGGGVDFWCISAINLNGKNLVCKLQYGTWTRLISMMYMYMYHSLIFNWMCKRLFHRLHTKNSSQETTEDRPKTLNQGWHTYLIPRLACTPQPRLTIFTTDLLTELNTTNKYIFQVVSVYRLCYVVDDHQYWLSF